MLLRLLTLVLCLVLVLNAAAEHALLSRHKRYITFPEGSAMTFLLCCNSVGPYAGDIMTFGLDVDMSWELPNDTRLFYPTQDEKEGALARREKRETYEKLEDLFDAAGMNGRACVLQTLCEVSHRLGSQRGQGGIIEELLKILFIMPRSDDVMDDEAWLHRHYEYATRAGVQRHERAVNVDECRHLYPGCPISLLQFLIG